MKYDSIREEPPIDVLLKYDGNIPRYTSYPPANFFTQSPAEADSEAMLLTSNQVGPENISLYFHIPFCPGRCLFCGCHTEIGRSGQFIKGYLETLSREFQLLLPYLDRSRPVTQIHFGGGTPNSVPLGALKKLMETAASELNLSPSAEIAMECDPSLMTLPKLRELRHMGFNRLSFGIQDLNSKVLQSVHREPSHIPIQELVRAARENGFTGVNLDLIYGLPFQTRESFSKTVNEIIEADPDRISLFPYAHVPWIKGHQATLQAYPMPDASTRLQIALDSRRSLLHAGYSAIGMDHFAKPGDDLAIAVQEGTLGRNFQGYCSQSRSGQVYALGASGISQLYQGYLQNEKDLEAYEARVNTGYLPIRNGYRMTPQDIVVKSVISELLCNNRVDLNQILAGYEMDLDWKSDYQAACLRRIAPLIEDGFATEEEGVVTITTSGFFLGRRIASAFDPLLSRETSPLLYSKAV